MYPPCCSLLAHSVSVWVSSGRTLTLDTQTLETFLKCAALVGRQFLVLARSAHQREGESFPRPLSPLSLDLPSNASRNLMAKGGYSPCSGCALRVAPFPLRAFAMRTLAAFLRGQAKRLRREGNEGSPQIHPQRRCEGVYRGEMGF